MYGMLRKGVRIMFRVWYAVLCPGGKLHKDCTYSEYHMTSAIIPPDTSDASGLGTAARDVEFCQNRSVCPNKHLSITLDDLRGVQSNGMDFLERRFRRCTACGDAPKAPIKLGNGQPAQVAVVSPVYAGPAKEGLEKAALFLQKSLIRCAPEVVWVVR
jgi:hypothetical protein